MSKYYLGKSQKTHESIFYTGNLYEGVAYKKAAIKFWGTDFLEKSSAVSNWEQLYQKAIDFFLVSKHGDPVNSHLPTGISSQFRKIKTVEQARKFASMYGLLGISHLKDSEVMLLTQSQHPFNVGHSIEPIEFWYAVAKKLRCIMSLYDAIQSSFHENSELDLTCEVINSNSNNQPICYKYSWIYKEGREELSLSTLCDTEEGELEINDIAKRNLEIGRKILINAIKPFINGYLCIEEEIVPNEVPNEHNALGIQIIEHKYTNNLITAIFYDLWFLMVTDVATGRCKKCGKAFVQAERGRKREFCQESCRVLWNRKNKKNTTF